MEVSWRWGRISGDIALDGLGDPLNLYRIFVSQASLLYGSFDKLQIPAKTRDYNLLILVLHPVSPDTLVQSRVA